MTEPDMLDRLAHLCGIEDSYYDISGRLHRASPDVKRAILGSMRLRVGSDAELRDTVRSLLEQAVRRTLPAVVLAEAGRPLEIPIRFPLESAGQLHSWRLLTEQGETLYGSFRPSDLACAERTEWEGIVYVKTILTLPESPSLGYHRFENEGESQASCPILRVPGACFTPPTLRDARRWGVTAQLYSLRSVRNWGMGDLTDLKALVEITGRLGGDLIGLNPLHASFPHNPDHCSPYSPSSRLLKNVTYLDIEEIPDYAESPEAQAKVSSNELRSRIEQLRSTDRVDVSGVQQIKFERLEFLYRHFREKHLGPGTERGQAFRRYQEEEGTTLRNHALYEALQEHFHARDRGIWGWQVWPVPYRHPATAEVDSFAERHLDRVEFYQYLQWQFDLQLASASRAARDAGLGIGLCADLAVGVDPAGAEAWAYQEQFALGVGLGAPPDPFNAEGQNWGLPPFVPLRLLETGYDLYVELLRRNMRHAGALRIDHILGLMRQYWVPSGAKPTEGAYVRFPFRELLGILALESQRNRCLVIGEDLGTVPDGLREELIAHDVLSTRLLYFERDGEGRPNRPEAYPEGAAVAISTHDLPTLAGYWQARDIDVRDQLGLLPSHDHAKERELRAHDRVLLLEALRSVGLLPEGTTTDLDESPEMTPELLRAIHAFLARTPSKLLLVQLCDMIGEIDPVNFPGVGDAYPSWRQKLSRLLEEIREDEGVCALASRISIERP